MSTHPTVEISSDLSIIIVSWNVRDDLTACLDSIQASLQMDGSANLQCETIVVDGASADGTVEVLRERYPWVKLLPQTENVGFTRGNNIGLAAAAGRMVLLLNPDTVIIGSALQTMVAYMDAHPDVGILGPHTLNTDGTTQHTKQRFPSLFTSIFEMPWLVRFMPRAVHRRYYSEDVPDTGIGDVDWVQGSALMTRRAIYEQIGGLDERYFMFSEELDWCKRIRMAGWRAVYLGTAAITHHGGRSTAQVPANKHIYYQQSKLRYFRLYHGAGAVIVLRSVIVMVYAWQMALEWVKGAIGSKRSLRRERVQVYSQVVRALLRSG